MTLALSQVTCQRGGRTILTGIDVEIVPGQVLALVGPNGAGKTSALQLLSGELVPAAGQATLDGRPLSGFLPVELAHRRAVLPQLSHTSFGLDVAELVAIGRSAFRDSDDAELKIRNHVLDLMGLTRYVARDVRTLSGGELQRVHLARVVAQIWPASDDHEPRYLLLDEPVSNLDPLHQQRVLSWARRLADRGFGIVITLHDLNHAASVANHVVLLADGRILASGAPSDVLTPDIVERAYGIRMVTVDHPLTGARVLLPAGFGDEARAAGART